MMDDGDMRRSMDVRAAFARYIQDRRAHDIPGYRAERFPEYVRFTPLDRGEHGFVAYTRLTPGAEATQIDAAILHFAAAGSPFEWKVYAYDEPADLAARLVARGFVAEAAETFMLCRLDALKPSAPRGRPDWEVRPIVSPDAIDAIVALQETIYGEPLDGLGVQLKRTLADAPATLSVFGAYAGTTPIGAGWIEYPEGSIFPELHGGGVLEAARGRGVYAGLFRARVEDASSRGYEDLAVDALPASRPILERVGFVPVCLTWPLRWPRANTPSI